MARSDRLAVVEPASYSRNDTIPMGLTSCSRPQSASSCGLSLRGRRGLGVPKHHLVIVTTVFLSRGRVFRPNCRVSPRILGLSGLLRGYTLCRLAQLRTKRCAAGSSSSQEMVRRIEDVAFVQRPAPRLAVELISLAKHAPSPLLRRNALEIPRNHLTGHGPSETVASPPDIPGGPCRRKLHGFLHKVIVSNDTDTSTAIGEDLGALGLRRPVCG